MKKQKAIGNKGFSLVELIIVIAIMAILVGVMAPQLLKYVERTRVSSDTQLADTVKTAVTTAILDPTNMDDSAYQSAISTLSSGSGVALSSIPAPFMDDVAETLGISGTAVTATWASENLKSNGATNITVFLEGSNKVRVTVDGSHADGGSGSAAIVVE